MVELVFFYDPPSPLTVHFRTEPQPPFTREDSRLLIQKHLWRPQSPEVNP